MKSESVLFARLETEWSLLISADPAGGGPNLVFKPRDLCHISRLALVAEVEDVRLRWRALRLLISSHAEFETRITALWSVRDLIGHLASWAKETRDEVEVLAEGGRFSYVIPFVGTAGPAAWNQVEVLRRREWTVEAVMDELEYETKRLRELATVLPDEILWKDVELPRTVGDPPRVWRARLGDAILGMCRHAHWHLGQINAWRDGEGRNSGLV